MTNSFDWNARLRRDDYEARICRLMTERSAIKATESAQTEDGSTMLRGPEVPCASPTSTALRRATSPIPR